MSEPKFKVGDVVQWKQGGLKRVVKTVQKSNIFPDKYEYEVHYYDNSDVFLEDELQLVRGYSE